MSIIYTPGGRAAEFAHRAANLYTGCDHNCSYCYVKNMPGWRDRDFYATPAAPRKDVIARLRKEAPKYSGTDERVLLCFACDPYCLLEARHKITRRALEILSLNDIPFQVLSKGGTLSARDFDLYGPNDAYATTLTFLDWEIAVRYEPKAALPADRILALQMAHAKGIQTWVSLEPVIDAEASIEIIRATHSFVDLYKIGKLNYAQSDIDWQAFAIKAIETCRDCNTDYYIKRELADLLGDYHYFSVDNRKIKRPATKRAGRTSLFS